jgi:putative Mn2+ efflux pump MntP
VKALSLRAFICVFRVDCADFAVTIFPKRMKSWFSKAILLFLGVSLVYLSFPTNEFYWDGVSHAQDIETDSSGPWFLHPNHLLYAPAGLTLWQAARAVDANLRALTVLRWVSTVSGAVAAAVLFCVFLEIGTSTFLAACLAAAFAFSAAWWRFSIDADAYVPGVTLLIISLWLLVRRKETNGLIPGLVHSCAMLLHQLAIFFYPAAMVALWMRSAGAPTKERVKAMVRYTLAAALPVVFLYLLAFRVRHPEVHALEFMRWVTSYSPDVSFSFSVANNIFASVVSTVKLFFGGTRERILEQRSLVTIGAGLGVIAMLVWMWKAPGQRHTSSTPNSLRRPLFIVAVVWISTYAAFLVFWFPRNTFYRLFYAPAIFLVLAVFLAELRLPRNRLALAVAIVFLLNFGFYIYPQHVYVNPLVDVAAQMRNAWMPGDTVYWDVFASDNRTIRYFSPQVRWKDLWGPPSPTQIEQILNEPGNVWFDSAALARFLQTDPELHSWIDAHCPLPEKYEFPVRDHITGFVKLRRRK